MPLDSNETDWIVHVNESVKLMPSNEQEYWKKRSIYRVPACITNLNQKAYQPQAVSFGPYHHGHDQLRPMEEHKHRALLHFLRRSGKPLEPFLESLREVAVDLKESYDTLDPKWKDSGGEGVADGFLELMITDGCFMLEILRSVADYALTDYPPNDPIFSQLGWLYIFPFIMRDMLMLENQLPKLVLDRLVAVERDSEQEDEYTKQLILKFCFPRMKIEIEKIKNMGKCLHVLDVYRKSLLLHENMPDGVQPNQNEAGGEDGQEIQLDTELGEASIDVFRESLLLHENMPQQVQPNLDEVGVEDGEEIMCSAIELEDGQEIIWSATELEEAGIQFEESETRSLKDIDFAGGVLRLPAIVVDDMTESAFLNLMTFERFHHGAGNEVTAYIAFMDDIIDNERDVALLSTRGIIKNLIGSNKAVADLFNSLTKDMALDPDNSLKAKRRKVREYCKKTWHVWRANLIKTYFRSPWTLLSLMAAIFLFVLTIIQTIYIVSPDG